jgi:Nucleotidyl transferase AbiEii toxin, Type IV TA system
MKDFYDIWLLTMHGAFDGPILAQAIRATFEHRQTALHATPVALTPAFAERSDKQAQWRAFLRRHEGGGDRHPTTGEPPILAEAVLAIAAFLSPVTAALIADQPFEQHWLAGGPWRPGRLAQR